jgi:hypothetical protein
MRTGCCNECSNERHILIAFAYVALPKDIEYMRHLHQALCLILLLIAGQQGAVVHEIGHISGAHDAAVQRVSGGTADSACALCPVFAQVASPAFSHSFRIPLLVRAAAERSADLQFAVVDAAIPRPRSRGPPSLS